MLDKFYSEVNEISDARTDLSEHSKAVVLVRAAIERSATAMGPVAAMYVLSRLMTTTLEIMVEDEDFQPSSDLEVFNIDDLKAN